MPYIEPKSEILCYMFFRHITSLQKGIYIRITIYIYTYISATPQTRRMKVLHCNGYIICFFHHITSLQKDLNLPPPPNNTYKGLLMVIFYLIENTSGAKGPLSPRKPRIRENQKFTSRTLPRLRGGLLKTRVFLHEKT